MEKSLSSEKKDIKVRMTPELFDRVENMCGKFNISRNEFLVRSITLGVESPSIIEKMPKQFHSRSTKS